MQSKYRKFPTRPPVPQITVHINPQSGDHRTTTTQQEVLGTSANWAFASTPRQVERRLQVEAAVAGTGRAISRQGAGAFHRETRKGCVSQDAVLAGAPETENHARPCECRRPRCGNCTCWAGQALPGRRWDATARCWRRRVTRVTASNHRAHWPPTSPPADGTWSGSSGIKKGLGQRQGEYKHLGGRQMDRVHSFSKSLKSSSRCTKRASKCGV